MTPMLRRPRVLLSALFLVAMPWLASAGVIDIEKAEHKFVVSQLNSDARMYVDAMQSKLLSDERDLLKTRTRRFFKDIGGRMHGATLARLKYSYEKNGSIHARTYHARSGRSMAVIAKTNQSGSSATESGDTDASSVADVIDDATRDAARDADEAIFYPPDTPDDVRVAALPAEASSIESVDIGDGKSHATDAEIKIARRIDADIQQGVVPGHGKLTGYVSKTVCESCRNALNELARRHDINGKIYQLIEPEPAMQGNGGVKASPDLSTPLGRSQEASRQLKALRSSYANATLGKKSSTELLSNWADIHAIERAEASTPPGELPDACE